jgi:ABC-type bacteriocin/lantibiotic exporter with double-glycine peptidase domain
MDEPTSSVDLLIEKEILANLLNTTFDSTFIISLHRLHLLPKFDSVIMLRDGKVIASGTITELLNIPGPVRELWHSYQKNFEAKDKSSTTNQ